MCCVYLVNYLNTNRASLIVWGFAVKMNSNTFNICCMHAYSVPVFESAETENSHINYSIKADTKNADNILIFCGSNTTKR